MNVFIAAHCNINNGDRAVLEATVNTVNRFFPNVKITVSAAEPDILSDNRFKVVGWPRRRNFICKIIYRFICITKCFRVYKFFYKYITNKSYLEELKKADIVFISGGHHLTDILGELNYFNLATSFLVPIYEKKRIYLLSQSIGPVENKHLRKNVKFILENVSNIAFRDQSSKAFLDEIDIKNEYSYLPDMVFSLYRDNEIKDCQRKTIGVALYCSYYGAKRQILMPKVIHNLTLTLEYYINKGYNVRFISMDTNDEIVAKKIIKELSAKNDETIQIERPKDKNILSVVELFRDKEIVLAYKTHAVIFSLINYVPVIAIAYHQKSIEFMEMVDLSDYAVQDEDAEVDRLCELIENALNNRDIIIGKELIGCKNNKNMIEKFFEEITEEME